MSRKTHSIHFILASSSPRREALFAELKVPFQITAPTVEEVIRTDLTLIKALEFLAYQKAKSVADNLPTMTHHKIIISADTIVTLNQEILGKPQSQQHAIDMLSALGGNDCDVITAYCILDQLTGEFRCNSVITQLKFKQISADEIKAYVATGDPMDKAGAFGIQGHAQKFIEKIDGDYDNVVGLPISDIKKTLESLGFL